MLLLLLLLLLLLHMFEEEDVDDLMSLWGKVSRMSDFDLHVDNNILKSASEYTLKNSKVPLKLGEKKL